MAQLEEDINEAIEDTEISTTLNDAERGILLFARNRIDDILDAKNPRSERPLCWIDTIFIAVANAYISILRRDTNGRKYNRRA